MNKPFSWGNVDDTFADTLARWIAGRRVLEVFAGNGLLARLLADRGVDIVSTSLFSGHDGHDRGMHFDVLEMEASHAAMAFGDERDILLMCWPTADQGALRCLAEWDPAKPVLFIGEVTDLSLGYMGLGGCASDEFFEATDEVSVIGDYTPRSNLDRASIRIISPERLEKALEMTTHAHRPYRQPLTP